MGFKQRHSRKPTPTSLEGLNIAMFSALRMVTFKKTIKRLSVYETLKYSHYMGRAVRNCQSKVFNWPAKLSDYDMADDPDSVKYW